MKSMFIAAAGGRFGRAPNPAESAVQSVVGRIA
jgi:hypothetical protein